MEKYGGTVIFATRDEQGPLEIVEAHGVRRLHFGSNAIQSALALATPDRLELAYLRTLLFGCLFVPNPSRILVFGLGGGSLARFFLNNFSDIEVDVIESRQILKWVARQFFGLADDSRITFRIGDAGRLIGEMLGGGGTKKHYDLILIDLCDAQGPSELLYRAEFWQGVRQLLDGRGVLTVNLWTQDDETLKVVMENLRTVFEEGVFSLSVPGRGNVIGGVMGHRVKIRSQRKLLEEAQTLGIRWGLELVRMLERVNPPITAFKKTV